MVRAVGIRALGPLCGEALLPGSRVVSKRDGLYEQFTGTRGIDRTPACRDADVAAPIEARSTRRNSAALAGVGCGVPIKWTSVASAGIEEANVEEELN